MPLAFLAAALYRGTYLFMSADSLPTTNRLLTTLSAETYQRLEPYLTSVKLASGTILYQATEKIETVYFPNKALISLVNVLENGSTTEISIIGSTGMVGLPVVLGSGRSKQKAIVQVPDGAIKISAMILKQEFDRGEELQKIVHQYIETRLDEVSQLAVCNRHHTIEERLSRWLLTVQDLTQADELLLTQEFLGNMLGVQRTGVTLAARTLQNAGLIRYSRGRITILNRQGLKDVTCECYQLYHDNFYGRLKLS